MKNGIIDEVKSFVDAKTAEAFFKKEAKKEDPLISDDDMEACLDNGNYDNNSGVDIYLTWGDLIESTPEIKLINAQEAEVLSSLHGTATEKIKHLLEQDNVYVAISPSSANVSEFWASYIGERNGVFKFRDGDDGTWYCDPDEIDCITTAEGVLIQIESIKDDEIFAKNQDNEEGSQYVQLPKR
jgi:hypothetical protein